MGRVREVLREHGAIVWTVPLLLVFVMIVLWRVGGIVPISGLVRSHGSAEVLEQPAVPAPRDGRSVGLGFDGPAAEAPCRWPARCGDGQTINEWARENGIELPEGWSR